MADPEQTTEQKLKRALEEMTVNIPPADGGTRREGSRYNWSPLKPGRDAQGRYAIIYSFDATNVRGERALKSDEARVLYPFTDDQRAAMRRVMDNIESVADIRFVEAGTKDPDLPAAETCAPQDAHLCLFRGPDNFKSKEGLELAGIAFGMENRAGERDVIIYGEHIDFSNCFHEWSHAVAGLSPPQNYGFHSDYSLGTTVMSFNSNDRPVNFGALDAALWQYIYGKSRIPVVQEASVDAEEAKNIAILHREVPVTIDLAGLKDTDTVVVDLSDPFRRQLYCQKTRSELSIINCAVSPGTDIVRVSSPDVRMHARGRNGVSLSGSDHNDVLMAYDGGNILTGGGGGDSFRFDDKSGMENRITDFTIPPISPSGVKYVSDNDRIEFPIPYLSHVTLQWLGPEQGTEIQAIGQRRNVITTVRVPGWVPEALQAHIHGVRLGRWDTHHGHAQSQPPVNVEIIEASPSLPMIPPPAKTPAR